MIRSFVFTAGEFMLSRNKLAKTSTLTPPPIGKTANIPLSPLEAACNMRVKAANADNVRVDLSHWAIEDKTQITVASHTVLRRFVVKGWSIYQERNTKAWSRLCDGDRLMEDTDAITDCIWRAKGCTYWLWTRGSRIFFWKLPDKQRDDFRDGIHFLESIFPTTQEVRQ